MFSVVCSCPTQAKVHQHNIIINISQLKMLKIITFLTSLDL